MKSIIIGAIVFVLFGCAAQQRPGRVYIDVNPCKVGNLQSDRDAVKCIHLFEGEGFKLTLLGVYVSHREAGEGINEAWKRTLDTAIEAAEAEKAKEKARSKPDPKKGIQI